jgi:hypothetical protein
VYSIVRQNVYETIGADAPWRQQIITDMMKSPVVSRCDFGYVYNREGIGFPINNAQIQEIPRYILQLETKHTLLT